MGGKSYFCDYCRCYMKSDVNVRRTHNEGMLHRMNKVRYMKKYEDPRKLYAEESSKETCTHYLKGRCRYDLLCQNSHFTLKQLEELKQIANKINEKSQKIKCRTQLKIPRQQPQLPWKHEDKNVPAKQSIHKTVKNLPPSLKPLNIKMFIKNINSLNSWG